MQRMAQQSGGGAYIWITPARMGGEPCIGGTRIPARTILASPTIEDAVENYGVTDEEVGLCRWFEEQYPGMARRVVDQIDEPMVALLADATDDDDFTRLGWIPKAVASDLVELASQPEADTKTRALLHLAARLMTTDDQTAVPRKPTTDEMVAWLEAEQETATLADREMLVWISRTVGRVEPLVRLCDEQDRQLLAQVAEQVDAPDSNSGSPSGSEGSSPSLGTPLHSKVEGRPVSDTIRALRERICTAVVGVDRTRRGRREIRGD